MNRRSRPNSPRGRPAEFQGRPTASQALIHLSNGFFTGLFGDAAMLWKTASRAVVREAVPSRAVSGRRRVGSQLPTAWLLWSPSRSAVDDLPDTRSNLEPEVGSCSVGSNRKRRAHPAAGSWLSLVVLGNSKV